MYVTGRSIRRWAPQDTSSGAFPPATNLEACLMKSFLTKGLKGPGSRNICFLITILGGVTLHSFEMAGKAHGEHLIVESLDQKLKLHLSCNHDNFAKVHYWVEYNSETIIQKSPIGIKTDIAEFYDKLKCGTPEYETLHQTYEMPLGKKRLRTSDSRRIKVPLANPSGSRLVLHFHIQNDGIAYRYKLLGSGKVSVEREYSSFAVSEDASGYMSPYDLWGVLFGGTYERVPQKVRVGARTSSSGWAYPALFVNSSKRWALLITEAGLDGNYAGTRLHQSPRGNLYQTRFPSAGEGNFVGRINPQANLPFVTPWRTMIIGKLGDIVSSTLVQDLSRKRAQGAWDWIRPGRVAWSWPTQGTGTVELQKRYIDFAARMNWEHVLIDDGWDRWPGYSDSDIPELVEYAKGRDVGIILWYNSGGKHNLVRTSTPRNKLLDAKSRNMEFKKLSDWGVAGIKIDFFWSDKQDRIRQYLGILKDAAKHRLMVNFHGSTIPRGWSRTYPNLMTCEAVNGAEHYTGNPIKYLVMESSRAIDHVRNVFVRNVVGSMDYTPVLFERAFKSAGVTYAHQLTLALLYESAWQHFSDRGDGDESAGYARIFSEYPFVEEWLGNLPVTWDDTKLLYGDPDKGVVLARRKKNVWYLAGINGTGNHLDVQFSLEFLDGWGNGFSLWNITSGDTKRSFEEKTGRIGDSSEVVFVRLKPRDGFVMTIKPENG